MGSVWLRVAWIVFRDGWGKADRCMVNGGNREGPGMPREGLLS